MAYCPCHGRRHQRDAVSQFWNDDKVSVADAMKKIATAAKTVNQTLRDPNMKMGNRLGGGTAAACANGAFAMDVCRL